MRFALLGDHPDGIDMARALVASGRHQLHLYSGAALGHVQLQRQGLDPRKVSDLEEVLADDEIDFVIVAGAPSVRAAQLRRALQSECHVLCVHPADPSPDIAYEAALIQADTGRVLLPLLPLAFHPGVARLGQIAQSGRVRLLELELWSTEEVLFDSQHEGHKPGLPGWDALRAIGGEIAEIFAQGASTDVGPGEPLLVTGRFMNGVLFQAMYLPNQAEARLRIALVTTIGRTELLFAQGFPGHAQLRYVDDTGESRAESWDVFHPWLALVERFEQALTNAAIKRTQPGQFSDECLTQAAPLLGWQDELRALELDDAVRRSAERGRSSTLDHQEATEEASFKGTMTLVGCSLIWLAVAVLLVSVWVPWLIWVIVPLFGVFLVMQGLRWVVVPKEETKR